MERLESSASAKRRQRWRINGVLVPLIRVATSLGVALLAWAQISAVGISGENGIIAYFLGSVLLSVAQSLMAARDLKSAGEDVLLLDLPLQGLLIASTGGPESYFFWLPMCRLVDVAGSRPRLIRRIALAGLITVIVAFAAETGIYGLFEAPSLVRLGIVAFYTTYLLGTKSLAYNVWKQLSLSNARARQLVGEIEVKNQELEAMAERAERLADAKGAFLATMSHEIRTPVNGILGTSELLLDSPLDDGQKELAQTINVSADTLLALINDILDFSKLEADKVEFESLDVELAPWMEDTLEMVRRGRPKENVELHGYIDRELPRYIIGDPVRLRQILLNLVSNALKFTEEGRVEVRLHRKEGWLSLAVSDTGIGMTPAVVQRLFSPFTQADASTTRRFGGTGLGLAISKRLIDGMGGSIEVRSEVGVGSTFTVLLPLREGSKVEPATQSPQESLPERFDLRVLVADDNRVNRMVARAMFEKLGVEVDLAHDGAEAVEMVRTGHYDLVFMDMQMPELDGIEATRRIRAEEASASIPIVALSANAFAEDRMRCREAGMVDFVSKPIRVNDLRVALARNAR